MTSDRRKIAVMDWDDQFAVANRVIDVLASFGVTLNEYQCDVLIDEVMDVTDDFSVGVQNYADDSDDYEDEGIE